MVFTVDTVYTVYFVYTVYPVYTVYFVYTVYTIETDLHCSKTLACMPIYTICCNELIHVGAKSGVGEWMGDTPKTLMTTRKSTFGGNNRMIASSRSSQCHLVSRV